jgi:phosphoribosylformylglycinamidine cyclo-ligase
VVAAEAADRAVELLAARGLPAWVLGSVTSGDGTVTLHGAHPA